MKDSTLLTIIKEYGMSWMINRGLYAAKLKMLRYCSYVEKLFEHEVRITRIDIFKINTTDIKAFLKKLPEQKQREIILHADNAVTGILFAFSNHNWDYKNPIDWHYSPITGKSSPKNVKWYAMPDFDSDRGDIKVIWEASRFSHAFCLLRAYLLTEDKKYFDAFSSQVKNWLAENPYSYGVNYKCGQECAIRMINILMAYSAFKGVGLYTSELENNVKSIVRDSYKKILSNFFYARKCIKNNHTISEIVGQIIGAWCSEDCSKMKSMYDLLEEVINEQFYPDGGYKQFSSNYHRLVLQLIECLYAISVQTGHWLSDSAKQIIKNSVKLLYMMQDENGLSPNYGSNDGALLFPITSQDYRDYRPTLNAVYALTTGAKLYEAGNYDEELLWLTGTSDYPVAYIKRCSTAYEQSGYYILRSGERKFVTYLQDYKSRPAHMDQLHIDLWYKGVNVFCDSGTFSYASPLGKTLMRTGAHNVLMVNDTEQMNIKGAFLTYNWTKRVSADLSENRFIGVLSAQGGSYIHSREVIADHNCYIVNDIVESRVKGNASILFHTPCEVRLSSNSFILLNHGKPICDVRVSGDLSAKPAHVSDYYYQSQEITCVVITKCVTDGKCVFATQINLLNN